MMRDACAIGGLFCGIATYFSWLPPLLGAGASFMIIVGYTVQIYRDYKTIRALGKKKRKNV